MPIFTRAARSIFPITRTPKSTSCWTMPAPPATRNGASRITASWRKYWTGRCRGSGPSTITISRLPSPGSRASPSSTATSSICRVPGGTRSDRDMLDLVGRKLIYLLPVLLAVTALTFLIAALLPGDLALAMLGDQATPENVAALHQKLGLDLPLWQQYLHWLRHVLSGDLGTSHRTGETVVHAIAGRLPVSLELLVIAQLGGLLIGVPLAMLCAVRPDSAVDRVVSGVAFGMLSMPPFLLAIVLIFIFARRHAGAAGVADDPARAAQRPDLDLAGRLHRHGTRERAHGAPHSFRPRAEALVADAGDGGGPQHRAAHRRRGHHRIDFRASRHRPAPGREHLHARLHRAAGLRAVRRRGLRRREFPRRPALRRTRPAHPPWPRLTPPARSIPRARPLGAGAGSAPSSGSRSRGSRSSSCSPSAHPCCPSPIPRK